MQFIDLKHFLGGIRLNRPPVQIRLPLSENYIMNRSSDFFLPVISDSVEIYAEKFNEEMRQWNPFIMHESTTVDQNYDFLLATTTTTEEEEKKYFVVFGPSPQ
jgi:hypothetical protein